MSKVISYQSDKKTTYWNGGVVGKESVIPIFFQDKQQKQMNSFTGVKWSKQQQPMCETLASTRQVRS